MALNRFQQDAFLNTSQKEYLDVYRVASPSGIASPAPEHLFVPFPVRRTEPNSPNLSPEICDSNPECRLKMVSGFISGFLWPVSTCMTSKDSDPLGVYTMESPNILDQGKYSHFYVRLLDSCQNSSSFQYSGINNQYLLLSFCETLSPELSMEVSLPLGKAEDTDITQLIDARQEYPGQQALAEDDVILYLKTLEQHFDADHPDANQ